MKKNIKLILFFLLISQIGLSQPRGEFKPLKTMECYKGLSGSAINMGLRNGTYSWGYRIKNNYKVPVQISCRLLVGGEEYAGGGYDVTNFLNPGETYCESSSLFTALAFNSNSTKYRIEIKDVCFNEDGCFKSGYAICDNGSPNQPKEKEESSNNNTENNSTNEDLISELNNLCTQLQTVLYNSSTNETSSVYNSICDKGKAYQQNEVSLLKSNIQKLKSEIERLDKSSSENTKKLKEEEDKKEKARQDEEERLEKEAARKQKAEDDLREQYNNAIQNGDSAMDNKQFSSAISHYSDAKGYAQTTAESNEADRKYNEAVEAKKTAERTERVSKVQAENKQRDLEFAALGTSFAGLAALLNDSYSPKWLAMKFQAGMGLESYPLISNNVNQYSADRSYIENFTLPTFQLGLKTGFFNNKGITLEVNPLLNIGFSALSPGLSGGYVEYGSSATIYLSHKGHAKFRIFAEAASLKREGRYNFDQDAASANNDGTLTTSTDDVREGLINYRKIKYGAGIIVRWIDDKETYVRPMVYYERASFFEPDTKPVLGFTIQTNISSIMIIEINYAKNYFIPGEVLYPSTLIKENKDTWGIKIIRQGKLF